MTRYLLLILFIGTMGSGALGLDFGLMPGISVKNALLYATFTAVAIESAIRRNRNVELVPVLLPFALLILYAFLSWLFIVMFMENTLYFPRPTLIRLKIKLVDQFLMLLVFFYGVVNGRDAMWLLKALLWVMIVGCLITVVDTFNIPDLGIITLSDDGRVQGTIGSAAEFGGLLTFVIPGAIALWWIETGRKKVLALFGIGLACVSILLTASRGPMLSLAAGAVLGAIYLRKYLYAQFVARAAVAVLALLFIAVAAVLSTEFGSTFQERMATGLGTGQVDTISSGRTAIWSAALDEMMEFPLSLIAGLGWESYYQSIGHRYATHNVYLDRLYNLGLIGFSLFVLIYANAVRILRRGMANASQHTAPMLVANVVGMISFMLAMFFADLEGAALYIWAYAGLALRIAITNIGDVSPHPDSQPIYRDWSRDQTKPATRPMSLTPRR